MNPLWPIRAWRKSSRRSNPRRKSQSVSNLFITLRRQNDENTCLFDFPCKDRQPVRKRCPDGSYRLPELSGSDLIGLITGGRETGPLKESWGSCAGLAERSMYMPGRGVHTAVSPKEKSTVPAPCAGQNPVMSTAIGTKRLFYPPNSKWMRDTHAERRSTG